MLPKKKLSTFSCGQLFFLGVEVNRIALAAPYSASGSPHQPYPPQGFGLRHDINGSPILVIAAPWGCDGEAALSSQEATI